jgi:hypothetical protein
MLGPLDSAYPLGMREGQDLDEVVGGDGSVEVGGNVDHLHVPPALDALAADPSDDVLLVCPGVVYRRDAIDWQHTATPHQHDLWRIRRSAKLGSTDNEEMISRLVAVHENARQASSARPADNARNSS